MSEIFLKDNKLIPEKEWKHLINGLKVDRKITDKVKAVETIKQQLINAVKARAEGKFGVLFSGGIDSVMIALILKQLGFEFKCYSVGLEKSKDLAVAKEVAQELGLELESWILELDEVEKIVKNVSKILKGFDYVNVSVGSVVYAGIQMAKKEGVNALFTGLGSEEIFAGYHRHFKAKDINEMCWQGLRGVWKQDLKRDYAISKALDFELRTPFLDKDLIKAAMMVPGDFKISKGLKKVILRDVALDMGLNKKYAMRKKLAAQYGSRFDKAIRRLAVKNDFSKKSDYVKSLHG